MSIVIPAHNEATVLGACLDAIAAQAAAAGGALTPETIVVANGCTDDTARIAFERGVRVLELAEGNKTGALNAGDAATEVFPRIYLDADIVLSPGTIAALTDVLDTDSPRLAAPSARYDTEGAGWVPKAFHRVFDRLPYARESLGGVGVYGLSRAGRARWATFPDVLGDDLFAQRHFDPQERVRVAGHSVVKIPRTTAALVAVRTRIAAGNNALAQDDAGDLDHDLPPSTRQTLRALAALVLRHPTLAPAALAYMAVVAAARRRARGQHGRIWQEDSSTR